MWAVDVGQVGKDRRSLADTMSTVARDLNMVYGVTCVIDLSRRPWTPFVVG